MPLTRGRDRDGAEGEVSASRERPAARRRAVTRRRLIALAPLVLAVAAAALIADSGGSTNTNPRSAEIRLSLGGAAVASTTLDELRAPGAVRRLLRDLPTHRVVRRADVTVELQVDRAAVAAALARAKLRGGSVVRVPGRPISSRIHVPLIKQALRDDCEAASLSMLMAFKGKPVGQLALQRQVAHSPPLDPTVAADGSETWGDPSQGFVGRADGGGPAGGFGVYQGPIQALARREGVILRDLTGSTPAAIYGALLHGHPVMVWVALSAGPYASWSTLAGKRVTVNYGEHAVVLTGVNGREVDVNDPLSGTRLTWARPQFERMWKALGRRALSA